MGIQAYRGGIRRITVLGVAWVSQYKKGQWEVGLYRPDTKRERQRRGRRVFRSRALNTTVSRWGSGEMDGTDVVGPFGLR